MDLEDEFKMRVLDELKGVKLMRNSKIFRMGRYPNFTRRLKKMDNLRFRDPEIESRVVERKIMNGIDEYNEMLRDYKMARMEDGDPEDVIDRTVAKCCSYIRNDRLRIDEFVFLARIGIC